MTPGGGTQRERQKHAFGYFTTYVSLTDSGAIYLSVPLISPCLWLVPCSKVTENPKSALLVVLKGLWIRQLPREFMIADLECYLLDWFRCPRNQLIDRFTLIFSNIGGRFTHQQPYIWGWAVAICLMINPDELGVSRETSSTDWSFEMENPIVFTLALEMKTVVNLLPLHVSFGEKLLA
ncbi:hypothetical protein H5410_021854 [Solanum commersonii]|uniref:Uncharacterized protein n=1 Tax=Solanum commersonii TaxID=4109 RepID=A0A9J5ZDQ6_SOLCO|nr:hypothetical protein H5410_021854 [Solanum commersonii]